MATTKNLPKYQMAESVDCECGPDGCGQICPSQLSPDEGPCDCPECAAIHADFIAAFGRWPNKTHAEGQEIARSRDECEASWQRALR